MTQQFPKPNAAAVAPARIETMLHVRDYLATEGPSYLLQALRTLTTHTNHAPLSTLEANLDWIEQNFPKSRKNVHPRPDLNQPLEAYKKWRADLVRAVKIATGARAAEQERKSQDDGWAELLAAVMLHTRDGGMIHAGEAGGLTRLADVARRVGVEPWQLADAHALERLESTFVTPSDRGGVRNALKVLTTYAFIPELAALLPEAPLPELPKLRDARELPDHVEAAIAKMVQAASVGSDEVSGNDTDRVGPARRERFFAALRHHLRQLPHCPVDPDLGYTQPVTDLAAINDVATLFSLDHVKATIRRTAAVEHLPGSLSQASAYSYYGDLLVVLNRNGMLDDEYVRQVKTSQFLREGRELGQGMRPRTHKWCEALLNDAERERRFRNMHRILQAKADRMLAAARAEDRALTVAELRRVRALGTAAAACAIEFAGRPIRRSSMLGLRFRGARANFFRPGPDHQDWGFFLPAKETKSSNEEPFAALRKELHGPQVLAWYLNHIRPLFPHADENIHLFPAVETPDRPLSAESFDQWFQRAAAEAGLPMTFHLWRHGYATLLLDEDWNNLQVAADMLGNTLAVCARSYAWIDKKKLYAAGQDKLIARARKRRA